MNKIRQFKIYSVKFLYFTLLCTVLQLNQIACASPTNLKNGLYQIIEQTKITVKISNKPLKTIISEIQKQSGIGFIIKEDSDLKHYVDMSLNVANVTIKEALDKLFTGIDLEYVIVGNSISIAKKTMPPQVQNRSKQQKISGKIFDENKKAIVGATVVVFGTSVGAISDEKGNFSLNAGSGDKIEISYMGMIPQIITIGDGIHPLNIILKADVLTVDDVLITGYFERDKNTFTGAAKTVSGNQIRTISSTNIMNALSILDPAIQIVQNNDQGSNPNNIPELIIRGTSSLNAANEAGVNSPLIVVDGIESNLRALYDIDIIDIESVTILKDASATALYGEKAANGVILVTRKRVSDKALRVSYNFIGKVEFPDVSDYNLMSAREKLDYERYAQVYDDKTGDKYLEYAERLARVNSGIDTDWIAKPLRNSFSHNHSASISGEGSGVYYQLTARYASMNGVMKDDNRSNSGIGIYLQHNLQQKFFTTIRADYGQTSSKDSKYGRFQSYVNANPYDAPYDADGNFIKKLSHNLSNPLYESTLSSFQESKSKNLNVSLDFRWNIIAGLYVTGFGSITQDDSRMDKYTSPLSADFADEADRALRGSYALSASRSIAYSGRFTANFNRNLDEKGSMIYLNVGGEIGKSSSNPYDFTTYGFLNDRLTDLTFGTGFGSNGKPGGQSSERANVALLASGNLSFRNRYFMDGSYRISGASNVGKDQRYTPFWSLGVGWNIHKEKFLKNTEWLDMARLRGSYGYTGSVNFSAYQAMTTYRYAPDLISKYGIGATPITMGNEDLKWQTTKKFNVGLNTTMFDSRLDVNIDYYRERTVDMIVPISIPPSVGVIKTVSNLGEQTNNGFEFSLSGVLIKNRDVNWRISVNGASNQNTLVKIGNALKNQNNRNAQATGNNPLTLYIEGESTTQLYVVRSAGIDPATGQEIFIDKNGKMTYEYNTNDKVAVGDTNPSLRGSASSYLNYKGFTFNISLQYSYGSYMYNYTRVSRIEQINEKYNADKRAYAQRWKKEGDVVYYLNIRPDEQGNVTSKHSQRFVEKENYLTISYISLGYEFENDKLRNIGFKRLSFSASMNEIGRFSTVRQERGTSYPFARGFSFTVNTTF